MHCRTDDRAAAKAKGACIRSRRCCSRWEQLGDPGNFERAGVMGFAALNPSYARSTCEVVGFRLHLGSGPIQNELSRLLILHDFLPESVTTKHSRGALSNKRFFPTSVTTETEDERARGGHE